MPANFETLMRSGDVYARHADTLDYVDTGSMGMRNYGSQVTSITGGRKP